MGGRDRKEVQEMGSGGTRKGAGVTSMAKGMG